MSEGVAQNVMWLSTQDRFNSLMGYYKLLGADLQTQINDVGTSKEEREILVNVMAFLDNEVIRVVDTAQDVLRRAKENNSARVSAR
jgi:hypothetical protein